MKIDPEAPPGPCRAIAQVIAIGRATGWAASATPSPARAIDRRRRLVVRVAPARGVSPRRPRRASVDPRVLVARRAALVVGVRRPGDRRRSSAVASRVGRARILTARGRFSPAQLLHEVVEQVAHRQASLRGTGVQGLWRPSTARTNAASTVSASSFGRIVAARAGSNRKAARTASGERHGRVGSSGGATGRGASGVGRRPRGSVPESAPLIAGPSRPAAGRAADRRPGRRRGS